MMRSGDPRTRASAYKVDSHDGKHNGDHKEQRRPELSKEAGYLAPNVNVSTGFGFLDLRREPVIVKAPDSNGLYFAYIGGKATGYKGGPLRSSARAGRASYL